MGSQYKYSCSNFNDLRRSIGRMNGGGGAGGEDVCAGILLFATEGQLSLK